MARSLRPYNWVIIVGLFFCLFGGAYAVQGLSVSHAEDAKEAIVPDQAYTPLGGTTINLHQFRGKTILVHYWASWCPPCVKEFPSLIAAAKANPDIVVITISVDNHRAPMDAFLERIPESRTLNNVYYVLDSAYKIPTNGVRVNDFPTTFIIKPDMTLKSRIQGGVNWMNVTFERAS